MDAEVNVDVWNKPYPPDADPLVAKVETIIRSYRRGGTARGAAKRIISTVRGWNSKVVKKRKARK